MATLTKRATKTSTDTKIRPDRFAIPGTARGVDCHARRAYSDSKLATLVVVSGNGSAGYITGFSFYSAARNNTLHAV